MNIWYGCKNVIFRPAWQSEQMPGIEELSKEEYKYILAIVRLTGVKDDPKANYNFSDEEKRQFGDPQDIYDALKMRGYIRKMTDQEKLALETLPTIKALAETYQIKRTGKKAEIIERLLQSEHRDEILLSVIHTSPRIVPTDLGYRWIRSLYEEKLSAEKETLLLLRDKKGQEAIEKRAIYEMRLMNSWFTVNYDDIRKQAEKGAYIAAWQNLWNDGHELDYQKALLDEGVSIEVAERDNENGLLAIRKEAAEQQRSEEVNNGMYWGEIHCDYDAETCKDCAKRSGKRVDLRNSVVGIDIPPFHCKCRCYTTIVMDYVTERWSRNPLTNESYQTREKNYKAWERSLTQECREALIAKRGWDWQGNELFEDPDNTEIDRSRGSTGVVERRKPEPFHAVYEIKFTTEEKDETLQEEQKEETHETQTEKKKNWLQRLFFRR